jgi:dienelactone hydrolase
LNTEQISFLRFPGTYHGFAVRGDERNPHIEQAKSNALDAVLEHFKKHLL